MILTGKRILITGGTGLLGKSLQKELYGHNIVYIGSKDCDLRDYQQTYSLFLKYMPNIVIHLAAKVGGVKANSEKIANFFIDNMMMNMNIIKISHLFKVQKMISLMSTCIFPNKIDYPLTEEKIHDGFPHESNFGYAFAKRMLDVGSKSYRKQYGCNFITVISNNLFGFHDNYSLEDSHVIPALIRKIYEAKINDKKSLIIWGNFSAMREFTYTDDIARIIVFLLENYNDEFPINIGNTNEIEIGEIVKKISNIFNYEGEIIYNGENTGQLRKPSNNSKLLNLGWKKEDYTDFDIALEKTCQYFIKQYPNLRGIK